MWLLVAIVLLFAGAVLAAGAPWPVAAVIGIAGPLAGSWMYLQVTDQQAPTSKLKPADPRTRRFLSLLADRYRADGYVGYAQGLCEVLEWYESGDNLKANTGLARLSSGVARAPDATALIAVWQRSWKDAHLRPR